MTPVTGSAPGLTPIEKGVGTGYYRRNLKWVGRGMLDDGKPPWEYCKWEPLSPQTRAEAVALVNKFMSTGSTGWQYAMLRCSGCGCYHGQASWVGEYCDSCQKESMDVAPKFKFKVVNGSQPMMPTLVRKEGVIWKLPKASSPMWTEQWGYQGSSKTPYIISRRSEGINGSMTDDGWACSCPNFTRHTPRTPCKHILNIKLNEGLGTKKAAVKQLVNTDDKTLAEFEKWQREKAANKATPTAGDAKLALFGSTGRKFR